MIGINVDGDGRRPPSEISIMGAKIVRCDTYPHVDLTQWIDRMRAAGIDVCLVLGSTALTQDRQNWPGRLHHIKRRYGGKGVYFQIGNEPDAGWERDRPSEWRLDERRAEHPSSWIMTNGDYQYLLECASTELVGEYLIGAGLCSGHPQWAYGVQWAPYVRHLAFHPYAKEPGTLELDNLVNGYNGISGLFGLWATETHARTRGLAAYLDNLVEVNVVIPFCYSDQMVYGFGLMEDRDALADYLAATRAGTVTPPPPVENPPVVAWPNYWIGDGIRKAIQDHNEIPISQEVSGMQMAATEQALYIWVEKADRVMRIPWERA